MLFLFNVFFDFYLCFCGFSSFFFWWGVRFFGFCSGFLFLFAVFLFVLVFSRAVFLYIQGGSTQLDMCRFVAYTLPKNGMDGYGSFFAAASAGR